jgi:hypothetical protein
MIIMDSITNKETIRRIVIEAVSEILEGCFRTTYIPTEDGDEYNEETIDVWQLMKNLNRMQKRLDDGEAEDI